MFMFEHGCGPVGWERHTERHGDLPWARGLRVVLLIVAGLAGIQGGLVGDVPEPVSSATADAPEATFGADPTLAPLRAGDLDREAARFVAGRSRLAVRFRDNRITYGVMGVTALPGEAVEIDVEGAPGHRHRLTYEAGAALEEGASSWTWVPPQAPGVYALQVTDLQTFEFVHLNVFVLHPRTRVVNGVLGGYRIGSYPSRPLTGDPAYEAPEGFIEVAGGLRDVLVSPHFTVQQFLCHQPGEPKFVALSHPLVLKLEAILERLNEEGYRAPTLHVMSGFRTPHYHRRVLGRNTSYSRHMYGDAADIFVDVDGDRRMDDLNGDGYSGMSDIRILARIVEDVERAGIRGVRKGGMGLYNGRNSGPFVHVDARGERARW